MTSVRDAHVALHECAAFVVLHEGKIQAEVAQAVRRSSMLHSSMM
jgi:hypothetical protein